MPERIQLKSPDQIAAMREAGLVVSRALDAMRRAVAPGLSTAELDAIPRGGLRQAGATASFLGHHGDPPGGRAPAHDRRVHGIPSPEEVLVAGDLISIDFGAVVDGWHGDSAISVPVGEVRPEVSALSAACETAMWDGLAAARAGARLSDISHQIQTSIRRAGRYGIVAGYGGHGIGSGKQKGPPNPQQSPPGEGARARPGQG